MSTEAFDVFVTDNGELVRDMLNGVVSFTGSFAFINLVAIMWLIALGLVALRIVFTGGWDGTIKWLLTTLLVFHVLILPKKAVVITDYSQPTFAGNIVEDVPIGLAAILSFSTSVGDGLVKVYETAFGSVDGNTQVSSFQYSTSGMMRGQKVLKAILSSDTDDPRLIYNVNNFLEMCVFPKAVTEQDFASITQSGDLPSMFAANTSNRLVSYKPETGSASYVECSSIGETIRTDIIADRSKVIQKIAIQEHPDLETSAAVSKFNLETGFVADRYVGLSTTGPEMISQVMAMNMVKRSMTSKAQTGGEAAIMDFVNARAQVQSRLTMSSIGGIMQTFLPIMHSIMVIVLIAIFPLVMIMAFTPGGGVGILKNYFFFFIYLQLWPILFSIFGRIVEGETMEKAAALAKNAGASGDPQIDMTVMDPMAAIPGETSALALMMMGLIPGIAWIVTKGASAVSSQLSSALRPINVATENAAQEGATGNISMGNTNFQNHAMRTVRADQVTTSPMVDTGVMNIREPSGGWSMQDGYGNWKGHASKGIGDMALSGSVGSIAGETYRARRNSVDSYRETQANSYSQSLSASKNTMMAAALAMREGHSSQDVLGYEISDDYRQALDHELSSREGYLESEGLGTSEQYREYLGKELQATAGISLGLSKGPVSGSVGANALVRKGNEDSTTESSNIDFNETFGINNNYRDSSAFSEQLRMQQSNRDTKSSDTSSTLAKKIDASLVQAESYRSEETRARNTMESLDDAYERSNATNTSMNQSLTPMAQEYIRDNYGAEEARAIMTDDGTNTSHNRAMEIQREAYEHAASEYFAVNPELLVAPESKFTGVPTDISNGMPNRDTVVGKHEEFQGDAVSYAGANNVNANFEQMSRGEIRNQGAEEILTGREVVRSDAQRMIGTSTAGNGNLQEAVGRYTPAGRKESVENYVADLKELHERMPESDVYVPTIAGTTSVVQIKDKPSQEQIGQLDQPLTESVRDTRRGEMEDRRLGNVGPTVRGRVGQSVGVGLETVE